MAKMRIYTVHINPKKKHPHESPVFVEEGWNWYAFLFHWIWALYNRLYLVGIGAFFIVATLIFLEFSRILHPFSIFAIQFSYLFIMGAHGNDLRRLALKRKGYVTTDIVASDNLVGAELRFFDRYFSKAKAKKPNPAPAADSPLIS